MSFEKWNGAQNRSRSAYITIRKNGVIALSAGTARKHVKDAEYCELSYDREKKKIGIKLLKEETLCSLKLIHEKNGCGRFMNAMSFFKFFDIKTTKGKRYQPTVEDGYLVITLEAIE